MRIIFVAHGDHNFDNIRCKKQGDTWIGHMDNQIGVFSVLQAYFSGRLPEKCVNIQITYGEEKSTMDKDGNMVGFAGAREVMQKIDKDDLIVVVDVTSLPEKYQGVEFSIQKCKNKFVRQFLQETFENKFKYEIFQDTPDTQACQDQTDAFRQVTNNVFFFGIQVYGGDYNRIPVKCNIGKQQQAVQAMIALANNFEKRWKYYLDKMPKTQEELQTIEYDKIIEQMKKSLVILEQCDSEEYEQEEDDWKQIMRKLKYPKKKLFFNLQDQSYETYEKSSQFISNLRKQKKLIPIIFNENIMGTEILIITYKSTRICNMMIKEINDQSLLDCSSVDQCFIIEKEKSRSVVISIKQKKLAKLVIYVKPNE